MFMIYLINYFYLMSIFNAINVMVIQEHIYINRLMEIPN